MSIDPFEGAIPSENAVEEAKESEQQVRYAGFWIRFIAIFIDTILASILILPLLEIFFRNEKAISISSLDIQTLSSLEFGSISSLTGVGYLIYIIVVAAVFTLFWRYRNATPGKMLLGLKVVDASSLKTLSIKQSVIRNIGYYVSMLPLMLGFFWAGFDQRKQGWHDKMAGTVVIYGEKRKRPAQG